ncbi:MAG: hypothetical protein JW955_15385 [Sedimentisphaerales bacterium]|nr:hypothetical protein [Sedimentisphaerales bacterium]
MSIKFHCDHCGKRIDAPDNAGGKWGKCPACHNKVYVPQADDDEELKLVPIDETEAERQKRLLAETFQITQNILQERSVPETAASPSGSTTDISSEKLTETIVRYLRQMYNGDLDEAQRTAELIASHRRQSKEIIERIATGDPPDPELIDIPPTVLSGFIRNLRTRIS